MKTEDEILVEGVSCELYKRLGDASIFSLPWKAQVVAIILGAQGIVDNGGFIYFFEEDWTDKPPYSVFAAAFRAISAEECAELIEVAVSLFPFSDPHLYWEARRDYLRQYCMMDGRTNDSATLVKLGDRMIDHSDTNYSLLAQYIRQNLHEIRSA